MKGLCGSFAPGTAHDAESIMHRMLSASHAPVMDARVQSSPHGGLAVFGTPVAPRLLVSDRFMIAVAGHPRLRLGGQSGTDDEQVLQALRDRGTDALASIGGDFALAAWDSQRRRGFIAVDRIGVQPLVYAQKNGAFVFASDLDLLCGHPDIRRSLSAQGIYDYLFYHVSPGPSTIFEGLFRLAPGHCLEFGDGATAAARPYWSMQFEERHGRPQQELEQEFIEVMQTAVAEAARSEAPAAFLSGGTDSSTVSGMLARVGDKPARTFSIGFDVDGYDEMAYARIAARHFGCEHHEYYVTPRDVVDAVPKIAASYDQPFGNASAIPTYYCARFAREHGVSRLLAGDGGDELFGGNERYGKHYLLGLYSKVPKLLRRGLVEPLLLSVPGTDRVPLVRKLRSYVEQARPPMPQRYNSYNLLMYLGQDKVFTPEFLASVDPGHPERLLADAHAPYKNASLINQMLGIDLRFILADGDLPKVTHMCELAGVDVAFPMLDDRVIEFSRLLASDLKLRGTTLRWFFKHALRDFLPPEVLTKEKHGFGLPVGAWLTGHKPLYDLAADGIAVLRQRGIVQPRFIDELLDARLREHAPYFGTMVWVLMMLGLWLDSRKL